MNYELDAVGAGLAANVAPVEVIVAGKPAPTRICDRLSARGSGLGREKTCEARIRGQAHTHRQLLPQQDSPQPRAWGASPYFFRIGGKSVQLPCATSAAMPTVSPRVGWG